MRIDSEITDFLSRERAHCKACNGVLEFTTDGPFGIGRTIEVCPRCEARKAMGQSPFVGTDIRQGAPERHRMRLPEHHLGEKCVEEGCEELTLQKGMGRKPTRCPAHMREHNRKAALAWNKEHARREKAARAKRRAA